MQGMFCIHVTLPSTYLSPNVLNSLLMRDSCNLEKETIKTTKTVDKFSTHSILPKCARMIQQIAPFIERVLTTRAWLISKCYIKPGPFSFK